MVTQDEKWQPNAYFRSGTFHKKIDSQWLSFSIRSCTSVSYSNDEVFIKLVLKNRKEKPLKLALIPQQIASQMNCDGMKGSASLHPIDAFTFGSDQMQARVSSDIETISDKGFELTLPPDEYVTACFSFQFYPANKNVPAIVQKDVVSRMRDADRLTREKLKWAYQNLPKLESPNKKLQEYYYRCMLSVLMCRYENPKYITNPFGAGGILVREIFSAGTETGTFSRNISLTNVDLAGNDTLKVAGLDGYSESERIPVKKGETISFDRKISFPGFQNTEKSTELIIRLSSISTSDSLISRLYRNASYALPGMVAENGRMDAGVFEYGNQWVRDGSNVAMGLIYSGSFESAKGLLTHILTELVSDEGTTVIAGGFDQPDREEFDQMGVLMNCLKLYSDWTGDISLLTAYNKKILKLIERPLNPVFRDSTGMVHNRREFWERTFSDAYELAYQTYMIQGLRDAADLSKILGVPEKADYWRKEADRFLNAMLHHPSRSLVDQGALIKRRNVTGDMANLTAGRQPSSKSDAPFPTEYTHLLNPDATFALPLLLGIIDPRSDLARKSLDKLETIWNARWNMGGYERYHSSSQFDQPGPWTFGTAFIARAQHDARMLDRSRRSLQWLSYIQGGNSGAWFEETPLNRSQIPWCGIVPWTSAEVTSFVVRHWLGVKVSDNYLTIKPNLFPGTKKVLANLRFRSNFLRIEINQDFHKSIKVNGQDIQADKNGVFKILIMNN